MIFSRIEHPNNWQLTIVNCYLTCDRLITPHITTSWFKCCFKLKETMFGLFKKKSKTDKMYDQYERLMAESHRLSTSDRRASDIKRAEAEDLLKKIKEMEAES